MGSCMLVRDLAASCAKSYSLRVVSTGITAEQNPGDSWQEHSLGPGVLGSETSLVLCVAWQKPVYTLGLPFLHLSNKGYSTLSHKSDRRTKGDKFTWRYFIQPRQEVVSVMEGSWHWSCSMFFSPTYLHGCSLLSAMEEHKQYCYYLK